MSRLLLGVISRLLTFLLGWCRRLLTHVLDVLTFCSFRRILFLLVLLFLGRLSWRVLRRMLLSGLIRWFFGRFFGLFWRVHRWNIYFEHTGARALCVVGLVDEAELEPEGAAVLLEVVRAHDAGRGLMVQGKQRLAGLSGSQKLQEPGLIIAPVPVDLVFLNVVWL